MVPQFAHCSIGSFLHPCESLLPFIPVLTTRIIRTLPLPRRYCHISIAGTQISLQALSLLCAYNTLLPTFPVNTKNIYFKSSIPQILPTSERGRRSNIACFAIILPMCCRQKWNSNISLQRKLFQRKKAKKAKRPNEIFKANQLQMRPDF